MHNVAQFWWCGMYAVRKSAASELDFFASYLEDRMRYAIALGRVTPPVPPSSAILDIGADIDLSAVEALFAESIRSVGNRRAPARQAVSTKILKYGTPEDLEVEYAENLPRFRWSFPWRRFVLVGIPDGITTELVYEFKAAENAYFYSIAARPIGNTQADLYGVFFQRSQKKLDVLIREAGQIETLVSSVDEARAYATLERFAAVADGQLPLPPKPFKCVSCEVALGCPIRQVTGRQPRRAGRTLKGTRRKGG